MTNWIEWHGGENPVPGKRVKVKYRNGADNNGKSFISESFRWDHAGAFLDIIAYRVVDEEQKTTGFAHDSFNEIVDSTIEEMRKLIELKGAEYSGDTDRLANFRRNGADLELPMETIWRVYCAKHWDAIGQYIRDIQNGKKRERLESIEGRVDDIIVYMLLFKAMVREREAT